ncbi:hypothetical protein J8273_6366 [Carpediemonas membranifera]|uniref:Ribosomal RNA-processing protein 12-like conserved domain-containing protein n=1 Tax=Carpediemonas membranifera TaxID=201153 RepID=A0A8J6E0B6_9EUKA|nr:hypothetical protein J8273_6366 [Carpediemonas membranifera]|eukprot:KAG9391601.1 hypothetical protein J8273_6366 [Carpediemonas membranifera]
MQTNKVRRLQSLPPMDLLRVMFDEGLGDQTYVQNDRGVVITAVSTALDAVDAETRERYALTAFETFIDGGITDEGILISDIYLKTLDSEPSRLALLSCTLTAMLRNSDVQAVNVRSMVMLFIAKILNSGLVVPHKVVKHIYRMAKALTEDSTDTAMLECFVNAYTHYSPTATQTSDVSTDDPAAQLQFAATVFTSAFTRARCPPAAVAERLSFIAASFSSTLIYTTPDASHPVYPALLQEALYGIQLMPSSKPANKLLDALTEPFTTTASAALMTSLTMCISLFTHEDTQVSNAGLEVFFKLLRNCGGAVTDERWWGGALRFFVAHPTVLALKSMRPLFQHCPENVILPQLLALTDAAMSFVVRTNERAAGAIFVSDVCKRFTPAIYDGHRDKFGEEERKFLVGQIHKYNGEQNKKKRGGEAKKSGDKGKAELDFMDLLEETSDDDADVDADEYDLAALQAKGRKQKTYKYKEFSGYEDEALAMPVGEGKMVIKEGKEVEAVSTVVKDAIAVEEKKAERRKGDMWIPKGGIRSIRVRTGKRTDGIKTGSEFRSKKGGGDVKKGQVDPYAYIPVRSALIRKKGKFKNQAKRELEAVFKSAPKKSTLTRGQRAKQRKQAARAAEAQE